jgi:hypothetical protein
MGQYGGAPALRDSSVGLVHGSENQALNRPERRKTETAEMCFLRHGVAHTTNGCTTEG